MSTTSLLSGKPPVASLLWIRDPLTLTSKEVLRPTFPLTIAPENGKLLLKHPKKTLGSINCCVCSSGCLLLFFCYPRWLTRDVLLNGPLEVPHAGGVPSGPAILNTDLNHFSTKIYSQFSVNVTEHWMTGFTLLHYTFTTMMMLMIFKTRNHAGSSFSLSQGSMCKLLTGQGLAVTINFTLL